MPIGIVEELFIATDPNTGLVEVWYRNSNVTQSLVIRNTLNANPVSVQWGTWKSAFVVETGSGAGRRWYIFNLVRVGLSSGADGLGPTPVAHFVRFETPQAIPLISLQATINFSGDGAASAIIRATQNQTFDGFSCTVSGATAVPGGTAQSSLTETGTGGREVTLSDIVSSAQISYGLDGYGDLILLVVASPPTVSVTTTRVSTTKALNGCTGFSTTTTSSSISRSGNFSTAKHLWVLNNTQSTLIFRTTKGSSLSAYASGLDQSAWGTTGGRVVSNETSFGDLPSCPEATYCKTTPTDTVAQAINADFGTFVFRIGDTSLTGDKLWANFSLIDNFTGHTASVTSVDNGTRAVTYNFGSPPFGGPDYSGTFIERKDTSSLDGATISWDYAVAGAWAIRFARPLQVVVWIKRTPTSGTAQHGLFLWEEITGRFTAIYPFTNISPSSELSVLTGRTRDIIWVIGDGFTPKAADIAYLHDLETDRKVGLTTDTLQSGALFSRFYKMLDFRFLYRAEETPGTFVSAWNAGGDPLNFGVTNPNVVSALTAYATLAALPAGVSAPVIGRLFQRDVIMKDDWDDITSGVISVADDGVGTDTGGPGDPVTRAIILCNPSTAPAAFIARFPGRSDGAEGTPARLNVTASQRVTENMFTSALSAQRYEDEPVVAFVVSAATSVNMMLAQELQSTGLDAFRCIMQPGLQPNPGADTHRAESVEILLRRGPGQSHPGTAIMSVAPVTSNILDNQGGTVGTDKEVPGLELATAPVKAPIGQLVTGRFLSFKLKGTNVNSVLRYLGSFVRGRRTT